MEVFVILGGRRKKGRGKSRKSLGRDGEKLKGVEKGDGAREDIMCTPQ